MKMQKIDMQEIGQKIAEINQENGESKMTVKFIQRWEERIIRITEVIHVDSDGESFGEPFYKDEEIHELTDSGEITSDPIAQLKDNHWIFKYVNKSELQEV